MRIAVVEWPDELEPDSTAWKAIIQGVDGSRPDILITNEMPFGPWVASAAAFDPEVAAQTIAIHEAGLVALSTLSAKAVISSRPVWAGNKLSNEAIVIEAGCAKAVHHKQYFPSEPGWYETAWFGAASGEFETTRIGDIDVGVLLCTELMLNEHARAYGRHGASLIAIPRATGVSTDLWHLAGKFAAITSGAYVVSSNRVGSVTGPVFGGGGFVYSPTGELLATTDADHPLAVFELDAALSKRQKLCYPCYVAE